MYENLSEAIPFDSTPMHDVRATCLRVAAAADELSSMCRSTADIAAPCTPVAVALDQLSAGMVAMAHALDVYAEAAQRLDATSATLQARARVAGVDWDHHTALLLPESVDSVNPLEPINGVDGHELDILAREIDSWIHERDMVQSQLLTHSQQCASLFADAHRLFTASS